MLRNVARRNAGHDGSRSKGCLTVHDGLQLGQKGHCGFDIWNWILHPSMDILEPFEVEEERCSAPGHFLYFWRIDGIRWISNLMNETTGQQQQQNNHTLKAGVRRSFNNNDFNHITKKWTIRNHQERKAFD